MPQPTRPRHVPAGFKSRALDRIREENERWDKIRAAEWGTDETWDQAREAKWNPTVGGPGGGTINVGGGAPGGGGGGGGAFNLNPAPRRGNGAYGLVPGPLGLPDPHGDLEAVIPGLDGLNAGAALNIKSQMDGALSPETIAALNNMAAERGVAGGMPGAQTWSHLLLGNVAGGMEGLKQQGIENYMSFIPTVSRTQTVDPALQASIANQNAINAAAPDPAAAASEAERLYAKYLQNMRGPGGGTGGGGGNNPAGGTGAAGVGGITPVLPTPGVTPKPKPNPLPLPSFDYGAWEGETNYGGAANYGEPQPTYQPVATAAPYANNFWDEYNQWSF